MSGWGNKWILKELCREGRGHSQQEEWQYQMEHFQTERWALWRPGGKPISGIWCDHSERLLVSYASGTGVLTSSWRYLLLGYSTTDSTVGASIWNPRMTTWRSYSSGPALSCSVDSSLLCRCLYIFSTLCPGVIPEVTSSSCWFPFNLVPRSGLLCCSLGQKLGSTLDSFLSLTANT